MSQRVRTIDQTYEQIREKDPGTALTKTGLRRLVVTGAIRSVRVGQKYLVSMESVENFLSGAGQGS